MRRFAGWDGVERLAIDRRLWCPEVDIGAWAQIAWTPDALRVRLTAREAAQWEVGTRLALRGRIQSRRYLKVTDGGTVERVAFEVSAAELERL